jgi:hypothetical protein
MLLLSLAVAEGALVRQLLAQNQQLKLQQLFHPAQLASPPPPPPPTEIHALPARDHGLFPGMYGEVCGTDPNICWVKI